LQVIPETGAGTGIAGTVIAGTVIAGAATGGAAIITKAAGAGTVNAGAAACPGKFAPQERLPMDAPTILVVDEHKASRDTVRAILEPDGFNVVEAADAAGLFELLNRVSPDVVLLDLKLRDGGALEVAQKLRERLAHVAVLVLMDERDARVVNQAMRRGVQDYLTRPVNAGDLRLSVSQALEGKRLKEEVSALKERLEERESLLARMGNSDRVQSLARLLEKIAPTMFTVLVEGESGAGKELVARAIHSMSAARGGPFVAVDCGAIPEALFESELFGYVKGAFTGASTAKAGFFEAADNGTLFLDEVCNLSYTSQQKLLRVIEERQVQRLGTTTPRPVNVRIIAATNRSLEQAVEARQFRVDLLYRLKEVSVRVPPLRERQEDIAYLANRFLEEFRPHVAHTCLGFSRMALFVLTNYPWPGNVRELRNVVRQALLTCEDNAYIQAEALSFNIGATVMPRRFEQDGMTGPRDDDAPPAAARPGAASPGAPASGFARGNGSFGHGGSARSGSGNAGSGNGGSGNAGSGNGGSGNGGFGKDGFGDGGSGNAGPIPGGSGDAGFDRNGFGDAGQDGRHGIGGPGSGGEGNDASAGGYPAAGESFASGSVLPPDRLPPSGSTAAGSIAASSPAPGHPAGNLSPAGFPAPGFPAAGAPAPRLPENMGLTEFIQQQSAALERQIITDVLRQCGGNKMCAARRLRVDYKTLYRKLKALSL